MQATAHNEATVDVNYGCEIHKDSLHRDICDAYAPDLIPMVNLESSEQIRFDVYYLA